MIIELIFPLLPVVEANRIIDEKISKYEQGDLNFRYMSGYQLLTARDAESYLTKTFDARKSLEDKAKTNVLGVTISVTLIMGLSQALYNSFPMFTSLKIIAIIIGIYALLCMILATVFSLNILGKYNYVYDISPIEKSTNNLVAIALNAEINSLFNIKRNNFLYSSYRLIINFLVSLLLLFLLITLPLINTKASFQIIQDKQEKILVEVDSIKETQKIQGQLLQTLEKNNLMKNNLMKNNLMKDNISEVLEVIKRLQQSQSEIINKINSLKQ